MTEPTSTTIRTNRFVDPTHTVVWGTAIGTFAFGGLGNAAWAWTDTPSTNVVALRFVLGATLFLTYQAVRAKHKKRNAPRAGGVSGVYTKQANWAAWLFVLTEMTAIVTLSAAVRSAPAALVTALAGAVPPLLALTRKHQTSLKVWVTLAVLTASVAAWAVTAFDGGTITLIGLLLALLYVSLSTTASVASVYARTHFTATTLVSRLLFAAGAFGFVWLTVQGAWGTFTAIDWGIAAGIALVPGGVGKVAVAWTARYLDATALRSAAQTAVVTSAAGAWIVNGEALTLLQVVIAAVLCSTVVLLARWDRPQTIADPNERMVSELHD